MVKRYSFLFFLISMCYNLSAQSLPVDPKGMMKTVTPTAPDVTNLGRYMMQAPNHSNGLPQQNIPLYEIKENGLSYPISLFYNYSGFKVTEDASSVGLGWGLSENVIIRVAKHIPDEFAAVKKFEDFGGVVEYENGQGYLGEQYGYYIDHDMEDYEFNLTENRLFYKLYDGQPDLYIYNCNGVTGKFLWLDNQAINLENNDVLITREWNYGDKDKFVLTSPQGVRYTFTEAEKSSVPGTTSARGCGGSNVQINSGSEFTTTWRLSEVKNTTTNAKINFTYKINSTGGQGRVFNRSSTVSYTAPREVDGQYRIHNVVKDEYFNFSPAQSYILDEISSDNCKISFTTKLRNDSEGFAFDEIKIYSKQNLSQPVKTVTFGHEYFGITTNYNSCWLKLKEVNINGAGSNLKYQFSYVDETNVGGLSLDKNGMSIDHWGYFNNMSNSTLIPLSIGISSFLQAYSNNFNSGIGWANRDPNFFYCKKFALESVQYPTGGSTKINYESAGGKGIRVASLEDNSGVQTLRKYYKYFPDQPIQVFYEGSQYTVDGCCSAGPGLNPSTLMATFQSNQQTSFDFTEELITEYDKVIEYIGTPDGQGGRTEYSYAWAPSYYNHKTLLTDVVHYAFGKVDPVSKEKYYYTPVNLKNIQYWVIPKISTTGTPVSSDICYVGVGIQSCCPMDPLENYHYILGNFEFGGIRTVSVMWYRLDKTETTQDDVKFVKTFDYKSIDPATSLPQHTNPIKTEEILSNGRSQQTFLYYPGDVDPDNPSNILGLQQMWDPGNTGFRNYVTPIIKTKTFVNSTLTSKETNLYSYDPVNNLIVKTGYELLPTGIESGKVSWTYSYDNMANIIGFRKNGDVEKVLLWGYNRSHPVAEVIGSNYATVAGFINQSILDNPTSDQALRDELNKIRIGLAGTKAQVITYTHRPLVGLTSITDANNRTSYYEYDSFGRLKLIRDQHQNIIKTFEYKYATQ